MRRFTASTNLALGVCAIGLLSTHGRAQICRYYELQKIWAWNLGAGEHFGASVAMDGDWLVVGAESTDMLPMFSNTGSAYVFRRHDHNTPNDRTDDTWINNTELVPWDAQGGEMLGISVSINGDRIIAGAYTEGCGGEPGCASGAAYVFRYNGTAWVSEQKLVASDRGKDLRFGYRVSISGGWLAVGSVWGSTSAPATGAAYLFRLDDNATPADPSDDVWIEHLKLETPQGATEDRFGQTVVLGEDRLIVGAPGINDGQVRPEPGTAYVYRHDDNGSAEDPSDDQWVYEGRLAASDGHPGAYFGWAIATSDDRVIVGSYLHGGAGINAGSAYIFRRQDNGTPTDPGDDFWMQEVKLLPSDISPLDRFGSSVGLRRDRAMVGAVQDNTVLGPSTGSAYLFRYVGGQWVQEQKLLASDAGWSDSFGLYAGFDGAQVVVGAIHHDEGGLSNAGAAYVYPIVDDCNVNCIPDEQDLADCPPEDLSCRDCNSNGIPDGCEDCNGNGLANSCDIDACPPEDLSCQDCNSNGMPDECDPDCNGDGVPDECDVAAGACTDDCECNDRVACTRDLCIDGVCTFEPSAYGDADHNDTINIFDLLCVLAGFAGDFGTCTFEDDDIEPCAGNGIINIFDLLAVLGAFAGQDPCCGG